MVTNAFVDPTMVLSRFLAQLQVTNVLIGTVQPICIGGSFAGLVDPREVRISESVNDRISEKATILIRILSE